MALQASLTFVAGVAIMAFKAFSHSSTFSADTSRGGLGPTAGTIGAFGPRVRLLSGGGGGEHVNLSDFGSRS